MATALHLEPAPCEHPRFRVMDRVGGDSLDDHATERGYCPSCCQWLSLTSFRSSDATDERALTIAEISVLKLMEAR